MKGLVTVALFVLCIVEQTQAQAPVLPAPVGICSGVQFTPGASANAVFQNILPTVNGNTAAALRDSLEYLKMNGDARLYWALWTLRRRDPLFFDTTLQNYGLFFVEYNPRVWPPVFK